MSLFLIYSNQKRRSRTRRVQSKIRVLPRQHVWM